MNDIIKEVSKDYAWKWFLMLIVLLYIIFKFGPKVWQWIRQSYEVLKKKETLEAQIMSNTKNIAEINEKLGRDYAAIQELRQKSENHEKRLDDNVEESGIIMKSLLAIMKGMQEPGNTGATKEAQREIENYLVKKSHEVERT